MLYLIEEFFREMDEMLFTYGDKQTHYLSPRDEMLRVPENAPIDFVANQSYKLDDKARESRSFSSHSDYGHHDSNGSFLHSGPYARFPFHADFTRNFFQNSQVFDENFDAQSSTRSFVREKYRTADGTEIETVQENIDGNTQRKTTYRYVDGSTKTEYNQIASSEIPARSLGLTEVNGPRRHPDENIPPVIAQSNQQPDSKPWYKFW